MKRQTNMNFEWLVINDGSTDDTVSLLEAMASRGDWF
ncbi:glycosyltransferase family 2 protein [Phocaeicola dorei]|nr:glycosyltransferase family 2 protein [Phocaeicola dorei]